MCGLERAEGSKDSRVVPKQVDYEWRLNDSGREQLDDKHTVRRFFRLKLARRFAQQDIKPDVYSYKLAS